LSAKSPEPLQRRSLDLSDDERLVLFDLLSRLIEDEKAARLINLVQHDAEIWALNSLYCELERTETASFTPEYQSAVDAARSKLLVTYGGQWPRRAK
jgi:hypothetical protein